MKYTKVIILVAGCVVVLAAVFYILTTSNSTSAPSVIPTPILSETNPGTSNQNTNTSPNYPPAYLTQSAQNALDTDPTIDRNPKIAALNSHLPIEQPLFKLAYDYEISKFVLTLQKGKEVEGSDAFVRYIQQYGVESDSWLNLKTVVE